MRTEHGVVIRRSDYTAPDFSVEHVWLVFDLESESTRVYSRLKVTRTNPNATCWLLNGDELELVDIKLDGRLLEHQEYSFEGENLKLLAVKNDFTLEIRTRIKPEANTALMGLYVSNGNFFTQCEAEGFRRITYFPDRPDVMTRYSVLLRADKRRSPVLLANGNLLASGDTPSTAHGVEYLPEGWHWALWEDPFPKPSYLFAMVAGNLVAQEQTLRTISGREVLLQVWVEPGNLDKTDHAMQSLIKSIRWDERRFGLELDLDRFMIVAVSDFNMGAMENKGLNIFNTKYVFANPRIATDLDFSNIESVVGHEYFHNWTGNRVTCRDWFQLTLKEGLTVFRDQEFSADLMADEARSALAADSARAVKRIEDVRLLRSMQFAEDAGPMAHPIRPDRYQEINNFYTLTVYEKGAEVVRMLYTLVGRDGFRRGMDLYFKRHDGQAVTCDDFVNAIADANGRDFTQFGRWYSQAGTPRLIVRDHYDPSARRYTLQVMQSTPPSPGQPVKEPYHLPLTLALLDASGRELPLIESVSPKSTSQRPPSAIPTVRVLEIDREHSEFVFENLTQAPVPSLLRGFSAPVILDYPYSDAQLGFLAAFETDAFNRWEAGQRLAVRAITRVLGGDSIEPAASALIDAMAQSIADSQLDPSFKELLFTLPAEGFVAEQIDPLDPVALRTARQSVRVHLASTFADRWRTLYEQGLQRTPYDAPYHTDGASMGQRALRNSALSWWLASGEPQAFEAACAQYDRANNMTDRYAALSGLVNSQAPQRHDRLESFVREFADEALVLDKWFMLQATAIRQPGEGPVLDRVRKLLGHPAFSVKNPNRFRSLVGSFCNGNLAEFHDAEGNGYQFWTEQVLAIDQINPQVAARLARALDRWRKFTADRQALMHKALEQVAATPGLSGDVGEIVAKALAQ